MSEQIRLVDTVTVFESERFNLTCDKFDTPDGQQERAIIHHPGSVAIIAEPDPGHLLLVRQYRYALQRETLEIPAGTLGRGEDPQQAAARELIEETGYQAAELLELCRIYPAVGICDELQYFYRASNLSPAEMNPDEGEFIAPEVLNEAGIMTAIEQGLICDSKTLLALQFCGMNIVSTYKGLA